MNFEYSPEYEKDVKKLDSTWREPLKARLERIAANPHAEKPLKHFSNVFSARIGSKRLVYKVDGATVKLACFKSRDEVYDYLKKIKL
ncbi:MAG: type II toxin-antitoxin system RelE/ParE family toxin [Candidatus Micrarchaeia archaeon]